MNTDNQNERTGETTKALNPANSLASSNAQAKADLSRQSARYNNFTKFRKFKKLQRPPTYLVKIYTRFRERLIAPPAL